MKNHQTDFLFYYWKREVGVKWTSSSLLILLFRIVFDPRINQGSNEIHLEKTPARTFVFKQSEFIRNVGV